MIITTYLTVVGLRNEEAGILQLKATPARRVVARRVARVGNIPATTSSYLSANLKPRFGRRSTNLLSYSQPGKGSGPCREWKELLTKNYDKFLN